MEEKEYKKVVANNLITLRKNAGYTQLQLAQKINYSDKSISKWERGTSLPDMETLLKLAELYGIDVKNIISEKQIDFSPKKTTEHKNRIMIPLMSVGIVWLVATIVFAVLNFLPMSIGRTWLTFIYAIPISSIVLVVFSAMWGRNRTIAVFVSVLIWSLAAAIYFTFVIPEIWLMFIICIPLQILTILWFVYRKIKKS